MGRSIGSGPAIHLAHQNKVGALLLISPVSSIKRIAEVMVGRIPAKMIRERFDNLAKIEDVHCPTFILHGKKDALIPFDHAK